MGYPPPHIAPLRLSASQRLVTVGDTFYLLNTDGRVLWKWDVGDGLDVLNRPFVDSRGRVFGVAQDGVSFSLDRKGRVRWRERMNGYWYYTRLRAYDRDRYLVFSAIDSVYRDSGNPTIEAITLYQDQKILAEAAIPRDSIVRVRGGRIYVITKHGRNSHLREVKLRWRTGYLRPVSIKAAKPIYNKADHVTPLVIESFRQIPSRFRLMRGISTDM